MAFQGSVGSQDAPQALQELVRAEGHGRALEAGEDHEPQ